MLGINWTSAIRQIVPSQAGLAAAAASLPTSKTSAAAVPTAAAATATPPMAQDDAAAVAFLMGFATDSQSLVAAYLSRQESGHAIGVDALMLTDEPPSTQPETARNPSVMSVSMTKPHFADAATQTLIRNEDVATSPLGQTALPASRKIIADTCNEFINAIRQNGNFPEGSSLTIREADDSALARFAQAMNAARHPPIGLRLDRHGHTFTAVGLKHIARLPLNALSIENACFFPEDFEALAGIKCHISLELNRPKAYIQNIPGYGVQTIVERTPYLQSAIALSTLQVLHISDPNISDGELTAIKAHPSLQTVRVLVPVSRLLRSLLANPRITTLHLHGKELREVSLESPDYHGLSRHPALKSLTIRHVDSSALIVEIAGSTTIDTLELSIGQATNVATLNQLSKMCALQHLSLRAASGNQELHWFQIIELCRKPLSTFQLCDFTLDEDAMSCAVRASAGNLVISARHLTFSSRNVTALCSHKMLASLAIGGHILPVDAARLAAVPTLTELKFIFTPSEANTAVVQSAELAWVAAGKSLSALKFMES